MTTTHIAAHEAQAGMYLLEVDGMNVGAALIEAVREPRDDVELTVWGATKMFTINVGRDTQIGVVQD